MIVRLCKARRDISLKLKQYFCFFVQPLIVINANGSHKAELSLSRGSFQYQMPKLIHANTVEP